MTDREGTLAALVAMAVPRETVARLDAFVAAVLEENGRQNLIAPSTCDSIWSRHVLDSAQLLPLAAGAPGLWCDIGSGAGFPGMVIAIASDRPVVLVEPRPLRAAFLERVVAMFGLADRVAVRSRKIEAVRDVRPAVISARAVASLDGLLAAAGHLSTTKTLWILPKGRQAENELSIAAQSWQLDMATVPSVTDPDSGIVCGHLLGRRAAASASGGGKGGPE